MTGAEDRGTGFGESGGTAGPAGGRGEEKVLSIDREPEVS